MSLLISPHRLISANTMELTRLADPAFRTSVWIARLGSTMVCCCTVLYSVLTAFPRVLQEAAVLLGADAGVRGHAGRLPQNLKLSSPAPSQDIGNYVYLFPMHSLLILLLFYV